MFVENSNVLNHVTCLKPLNKLCTVPALFLNQFTRSIESERDDLVYVLDSVSAMVLNEIRAIDWYTQ